MSLPLDWNIHINESLKANTSNPYPYLSILEDICSYIKGKDSSSVNFDIGNEGSQVCTNSNTHIYPYATLLQKFIQEAEINNSGDFLLESKEKLDENLRYIMRTLYFDVQPQSNSCNDKLLHSSYDFTYTSKLKHMASLTERMDYNDNSNFTSNLNEINEVRFFLKNVFPTIKLENSESMVYSEKLQRICEQMKEDTKSGETVPSPLNYFSNFEENSLIIDNIGESSHSRIKTEFQKYEENDSEIFDMSKYQSSSRQIDNFGISSGKNCTSEAPKSKKSKSSFGRLKCTSNKNLFEALMENVKFQSMPQNEDVNFVKEESSIEFKVEPYSEVSPSDLGEAGIKILERRLMKHLHS